MGARAKRNDDSRCTSDRIFTQDLAANGEIMLHAFGLRIMDCKSGRGSLYNNRLQIIDNGASALPPHPEFAARLRAGRWVPSRDSLAAGVCARQLRDSTS